MTSPYTGDPTKDSPTIQLIDDSDAPTASNFNPPQESLANSVAYLRQNATGNDGLNWSQPATWPTTDSGSSSSSVVLRSGAIWNPIYAFWVTSNVDATSEVLFEFFSYNGTNWSSLWDYSLGSTGSKGYGHAVSPVNGTTLTWGTSSLGGDANVFWNPSTGGITTTLTSAGTYFSDPSVSSGWWSGTALTISATHTWVAFKGNSNAGPIKSVNNGVTWSAAATWSPAGFITHNSAWYNDGTQVVLFPASTSTNNSLAHSSDLTNWTFAALPSLIDLGAVVVGAGYDSFSQAYYFASSNTSTTRIWMSATGIGSWTNIATVSHQSYGFTNNQRELLLWISLNKATESASTQYRPLRSVDSGATWQLGAMGTSTAPGTYFKLSGGGSNAPGAFSFVYNNSTEFSGSIQIGRGTTLTV